MSLPDFILTTAIIAGISLVATIVLGLMDNDAGFVTGIILIASGLLTVILFAVVSFASYHESKDRNYCESLEKRGHQTQFMRYSRFSYECYIKIDGQWVLIDGTQFDRSRR